MISELAYCGSFGLGRVFFFSFISIAFGHAVWFCVWNHIFLVAFPVAR